jgi:hypothetical protein
MNSTNMTTANGAYADESPDERMVTVEREPMPRIRRRQDAAERARPGRAGRIEGDAGDHGRDSTVLMHYGVSQNGALYVNSDSHPQSQD